MERVLRTVAALAAAVLLLTAISRAVGALDRWPALVVVAAVALLGYLAARLLAKRIASGTVLEVDLDGGVVETTGSDPLSLAMSRRAVKVRDFVEALHRAADDPRVVGVVARLGNGAIGLGHAQEMRDAISRFRASGKEAVAFAESFGESGSGFVDYYLAASFSKIYLQPLGSASIQGLLARSPFLRGLFDKVGVFPDFEHREEYKAAKYLFTETRFTEPHREATQAVASDQFDQIVSGIATGRGLRRDEVGRLIDSAPLTAQEARQAGLVDHIGYRDEAYRAAGGDGSNHLFCDRYLKKAGRPHRRGRRIALIYGTGSIARGGSRFDPLTGGSSLGADDVAKAFRQAVDDDKVKAIVFRVDSPGGSAVASEVVAHEVRRARDAGKPVVVSMANVAGSGGYWVAAGADQIVAQPGTITGSIGVVSGKLANREAWARLGVTFDQIPLGENSSFSASQDPYTEGERHRLGVLIDDVYESFLHRVSDGRNLERERVEEIAKGRIWTGGQAHELGLVDRLGGLEEAVAAIKDHIGIADEDDVQLKVFPPERTIPLPRREDNSEPIRQAGAVVADLVTDLGIGLSGVQARMPWVRPG